jgi:hypothetical protein
MMRSSTERQSRAGAGERVHEALSRVERRMVEQLRKRHGRGTAPASLPDWHELGSFIDRVMESSLRSVEGAAKGLAELIGCSAWEIPRSRLFAATYSMTEAKRRQGNVSWSLIVHLLSVMDKKEREALEKECIGEGWSFVQLRDQIRARYGRRLRPGQVGRPARRPANRPEALVQLANLMNAVVRWYRRFESGIAASDAAAKSQPQKAFDATQLPPRLRQRIEKAVRELEGLCSAVEAVLEVGIDETETRRQGPPKKGRDVS